MTALDVCRRAPEQRNYRAHTARQAFFASDGGRVAYVDEGSGPTILLVHGFPTSSWMFRNIIPRLVQSGFRVIAPDLLGFGNSAKPGAAELYTSERQADRILKLMHSLKIVRWTAVCHDLGGPWTWEIIDREPGPVERLVVLNTTAYANGWRPPHSMVAMASPLGPALLSLLANRWIGARLSGTMLNRYVSGVLSPEVREGYLVPLREGASTSWRIHAQVLRSLPRHFERYQAALRRFEAPASIIWGRQDPIVHCETMTGQFSEDLRISTQDLHVLENASHYLCEDEPHRVASLIVDFAKRSCSGPAPTARSIPA